MANLVQTLIPILFLLLAGAATPARSQSSSTSFYYDFCGPQSTGLTFQGDTQFVSNATFPWNSTFLRLTSARHAVVGRVLYTHPVQFWQTGGQVDFETTFKFYITPNVGHSAADGIVFFIAPVGSTLPNGAGGANFGVFDSSGQGAQVFAVEFDTYINAGWDPNYRHIGIDLGSWTSRNTTNVGNAIVGREVTARINYVGATRRITAVVTAGWQTFEVSLNYDLSGFLPQQVQVGLSATTGLSGNYISTHDVKSWYFAATMNAGRGAGAGEIREVV